MKKLNQFYEPHLTIREVPVLPGGEWPAHSTGWSLIQVESGTGYWLDGPANAGLESGTTLLVANGAPGRIRASQLNGMKLRLFNVMPERLTGLITLDEQDFLKRAAARKDLAFQMAPASSPLAGKMRELCGMTNGGGAVFRLKLLALFFEAFGRDLDQAAPARNQDGDARARLQQFLQEAPPDALLEMSFKELAKATHCTTRHLSRIFYDLAGMSFRDKRAEIRMARARELLATSNSKVVEVALESGYKSLSLFNLMFARRFGTSPGRWRQKQGANGNGNHQNHKLHQDAACRR